MTMKTEIKEEPILKLWRAYINVTKASWSQHPALLTSGFSALLHPRLTSGLYLVVRDYYVSLKCILKHVFGSGVGKVCVPGVDVLLFASTNKPSFMPATRELAVRLVNNARRCTLLSLQNMTTFEYAENGCSEMAVPHYDRWLYGRMSFTSFLGCCTKTTFLTFYICLKSLTTWTLTPYFLTHLFQVWVDVYASLHRFSVLRDILIQAKPKLVVVNHERVPVAAELIALAKEMGIHTVLFTNEWPTVELEPVVSDEVWVWNEHSRRLLKEVVGSATAHKISVVGIAELDFAISQNNVPTLNGQLLHKELSGRSTIVYLSQMVSQRVDDRITAKIIEILYSFAKKHPEWALIYKSRPGKNESNSKVVAQLKGLNNVFMADAKITLAELLNMDNVKAVAALNSSGLVIGVGMKKMACRFVVPGEVAEYPLLNQLSRPIATVSDLEAALSDALSGSYDSHIHAPLEDMFPYRGLTVGRMEQECIRHLLN